MNAIAISDKISSFGRKKIFQQEIFSTINGGHSHRKNTKIDKNVFQKQFCVKTLFNDIFFNYYLKRELEFLLNFTNKSRIKLRRKKQHKIQKSHGRWNERKNVNIKLRNSSCWMQPHIFLRIPEIFSIFSILLHVVEQMNSTKWIFQFIN